MSKVHMLRGLVEQRLTLAAEEIFELFERTMGEYEEELCRQRKLLNAVLQPEVRLHRADVQQLMANREAVSPEQQIWSPSLDQQNPPELPNIKQEQEELWTKQEEEQLQLLEEADITKFTITPVKSEDEEGKPQTSLLHQSQTEELRDAEHLKTDTDEEHSGRSEPSSNLNPDNHLETATSDKTSHFSEPETDDSCDWEEMRDSESGLKPLQNNKVLLSDNEKRLHSATNRFSCSVCTKTFLCRQDLKTHMRSHTGRKPFSCSFCGKKFPHISTLSSHLRVHTGEKPFSCSVCGKKFSHHGSLTTHSAVHTGEKPYSCSVCGKRFTQLGNLTTHSAVHTGEKPFSCSVCGKRFAQHGNMRTHYNVHTGEKPFHCSMCDKRFAQLQTLKKHKCVGDKSRNK